MAGRVSKFLKQQDRSIIEEYGDEDNNYYSEDEECDSQYDDSPSNDN